MEASKRHYAMDICPGFWHWVDQVHAAGRVRSIHDVKAEILAGDDERLTQWVRHRPRFFVPLDPAAIEAQKEVAAWVAAAEFTQRARKKFLKGADQFLVAYAMAHGLTVVTEEAPRTDHLKIPTVCRHLNVECTSSAEMLRAEGVRLVLEQSS